jgi:hypothetical protein
VILLVFIMIFSSIMIYFDYTLLHISIEAQWIGMLLFYFIFYNKMLIVSFHLILVIWNSIYLLINV